MVGLLCYEYDKNFRARRKTVMIIQAEFLAIPFSNAENNYLAIVIVNIIWNHDTEFDR